MPWQETNPMLERHHFAHDLGSGQWTMTELCTRYGISRNTGYKWLERYRQLGCGRTKPSMTRPRPPAGRPRPGPTPSAFRRLFTRRTSNFGG
ncbi:MAG: helix-turn-helix domain-containing protein [Gemmatimonadaceae bacterium]